MNIDTPDWLRNARVSLSHRLRNFHTGHEEHWSLTISEPIGPHDYITWEMRIRHHHPEESRTFWLHNDEGTQELVTKQEGEERIALALQHQEPCKHRHCTHVLRTKLMNSDGGAYTHQVLCMGRVDHVASEWSHMKVSTDNDHKPSPNEDPGSFDEPGTCTECMAEEEAKVRAMLYWPAGIHGAKHIAEIRKHLERTWEALCLLVDPAITL